MFPQWTEEITERYVKGEDQLGIQGAAQSYQQYLVPGVITTTDRARYYSFYAWILYRFITDPNSSRLLKDFRGDYFRKHEVAMILASFSHHKDGDPILGLVGSGINDNKARQYWESGDPVSLDQDYFQNTLGGFGQYYRTSMDVMGIINEQERAGWVYRLTPRGRKLAEAYRDSIKHTKYYSKLDENNKLDSISHEDAQELGEVGCICGNSLSQGKDFKLLRETFFRFDQAGIDNPHVRRRLTLGVTLDLVRGGNGEIKESDFRTALYLGEFSPDLKYKPSEKLLSWVHRWKMVQIRQMYTFGLECLWAAFLYTLKDEISGFTFDEFLEGLSIKSSIRYEEDVGGYLNDIVNQFDISTAWKLASSEFAEYAGLGYIDNEYQHYLNARGDRNNVSTLLESGLKILLTLFLRFYSKYSSEDRLWNELATQQRLPLNLYFRKLENKLQNPNFTIGDFLSWIYSDFILGQHEYIALEKLRYQEYDTFKFYYQDGRFYWPYQSRDAYEEPIRFASLRLFNTRSLLSDLKLIQEDDEGFLSLTATGEKYLNRILRNRGDDN